MTTNNFPAQTPILDLLDDIPADARMMYNSAFSSQNIPIGDLAKQAAEALRSQQKRIEFLEKRDAKLVQFNYESQYKLTAIQRALPKGLVSIEAFENFYLEVLSILDTVKDAPVCKEALPPVDSAPAQQPEQGSKE